MLAGTSFAVSDYSLRARVGVTAATATAWTSVSQIWVRVAYGGGHMLGVTVTLERHSSTTTSVLSFDRASVDKGHRCEGE